MLFISLILLLDIPTFTGVLITLRHQDYSHIRNPFRLSFPDLLSDGTFTEVRLLGGHSL